MTNINFMLFSKVTTDTKKAYAKVNIFLKIVGINGNYHNLVSRFILIKELYDEISFELKVKSDDDFELIGDFNCPTKSNTIYKAYLLMKSYSNDIEQFFKTYKVVVKKNIPSFAGLGGGSSDSATFILMLIDKFNLKISFHDLMLLGKEIGADVPFFLSGYESANVSGIGEKVEEFEEEIPKLDIVTPDVECSTKEIFRSFRENLQDGDFEKNIAFANEIKNLKSVDILKNYQSYQLNDLFKPALRSNGKLDDYAKQNMFFSGSGSSFYKLVN